MAELGATGKGEQATLVGPDHSSPLDAVDYVPALDAVDRIEADDRVDLVGREAGDLDRGVERNELIELDLQRLQVPFAFLGETQVTCAIEGESARDFNVMTLRTEYAHDVEVVRAGARFVVDDDELVFGYVLAGVARVHETTVHAGETVYLDGVESFDVHPWEESAVALVRITPV